MREALRSVPVLAVILQLTVCVAQAAEPAPSAEEAPADQSSWVGTWALDKKASDPIEPMLELMDVPWYLKTLAKTFTPQFTISVDGAGFDWASKSPLGSRTQHFRADGVSYPGEDQLDRKFTQASQWDGDALVVDRTTDLPSGKKMAVQSRWTLEGNTLTSHMTVTPEGAKPMELRRVFQREPSEGGAAVRGMGWYGVSA